MTGATRHGLLLVLLTLGAGAVQAQGLAAKLTDARTAARAEVALAGDEALRAFAFSSTAEAGVLTIIGVVETTVQRDRVTEVVRALEGVERVVNHVQATEGGGTGAIPDTASPPEDDGARQEDIAPVQDEVYHTVRSGDTLGAIAQRYGVTVRQVQQLNGLRGSRIRAGQRLRVK